MANYKCLFVSANDLFVQQFIRSKRREIEVRMVGTERTIQRVKEDWIAAERSELASLEKEIASIVVGYDAYNSASFNLKELNEAQYNIMLRKAKLEAVVRQEISLKRLSAENEGLKVFRSFLFELSDDITITGIKRKVNDIREEYVCAKEAWIVEEDEALVKLEEDINAKTNHLDKIRLDMESRSCDYRKNPYYVALEVHISELHDDFTKRRSVVEAIKQPDIDNVIFPPEPLTQLYGKLILWVELDRDLQRAMLSGRFPRAADGDMDLLHEDEGPYLHPVP